MQARFITREDIEAAAAEIGVRVEIDTLNAAGDRHKVKLFPLVPVEAYTPSGRRRRGENGDAPYQRVGVMNDGRRVNAVCWHGFRDFFRACYRRAPDAVFRTAVATWKGSQDFEERYRATGYANVGSMMFPIAHANVCRCPDSGLTN